MSAKSELRDAMSLLLTRRFGTFWISTLFSNIGTWAQQIAEPWLLLTIGATPFLVGLDSFVTNAPVWALTLVGGALADRRDRRRVIGVFQTIQMLCPAAIVAMLVTHTIRAPVIVALSLVVGITDALSMPSFQSIVPSIVERENIARGLALNSTQFNLSRILGPAIAGVLMASVGAVACFALSVASYVPFIGVALWILPRSSVARSREAVGAKRPLAGLRQIARAPKLRGALLTVLVTSTLCGPLVTFVPVLVRDAFHGDAARFSAAVGGFGIGGVAGALGLLAVPLSQDRRRWSFAFALVYPVVVVATAILPSASALPFVMIAAGAAMTVTNTCANTVLQSAAERGVLGRTVSLFMLVLRGGLALGALVTGVLVERLGVRHALALNGVLAIALQLIVGRVWLAKE